jgi:hypothetical protein
MWTLSAGYRGGRIRRLSIGTIGAARHLGRAAHRWARIGLRRYR